MSPIPESSVESVSNVDHMSIMNTVIKFLETHTAYDALPASGRVSVFNSNMPICLAFECLRSQGRRGELCNEG